MRLRLLPYFIEQALTNVMSNRVVHVIGLGTMVASLLIFGTFLLLFVNLNNWMEGWGHSLSMSVYIEDGASAAAKDRIASAIKGLPGAELKRVITKDEALREFKKALGSQAGLLEGLAHNPLPASFEVQFDVPEGETVDALRMKEALTGLGGGEDVHYSE